VAASSELEATRPGDLDPQLGTVKTYPDTASVAVAASCPSRYLGGDDLVAVHHQSHLEVGTMDAIDPWLRARRGRRGDDSQESHACEEETLRDHIAILPDGTGPTIVFGP
jgi:hypothetical protein